MRYTLALIINHPWLTLFLFFLFMLTGMDF